jgi:hypothetical protein
VFIDQQKLSSDLSKAIPKKIPASNCGKHHQPARLLSGNH